MYQFYKKKYLSIFYFYAILMQNIGILLSATLCNMYNVLLYHGLMKHRFNTILFS